MIPAVESGAVTAGQDATVPGRPPLRGPERSGMRRGGCPGGRSVSACPRAANVRSVAMECARVLKRMDVPGAVAVPVAVGAYEWGVGRAAVRGPVVSVAMQGAMPVPSMVVRAMAVRVPAVVTGRMTERRRVRVHDGEERQQGPEREPCGFLATMMPAVVPPARLRGGGNQQHGGHQRDSRKAHCAPRAARPAGQSRPVVHRSLPQLLGRILTLLAPVSSTERAVRVAERRTAARHPGDPPPPATIRSPIRPDGAAMP